MSFLGGVCSGLAAQHAVEATRCRSWAGCARGSPPSRPFAFATATPSRAAYRSDHAVVDLDMLTRPTHAACGLYSDSAAVAESVKS